MPLSPEQMGAIRNMLDQQAKQQAAQQQVAKQQATQQQEQQQTYPIISEEIDRYIQQRRGSPDFHLYKNPVPVYEPKGWTWWDSFREWAREVLDIIGVAIVIICIVLGILLVICPFR